jgi:hypothetical protein
MSWTSNIPGKKRYTEGIIIALSEANTGGHINDRFNGIHTNICSPLNVLEGWTGYHNHQENSRSLP